MALVCRQLSAGQPDEVKRNRKEYNELPHNYIARNINNSIRSKLGKLLLFGLSKVILLN